MSLLHPETDYRQFVQLGTILLAGEVAERILDERAELTCAKHDLMQVDTIVDLLFEGNAEDSSAWIRAMKEQASACLKENWDAVRALGEVLSVSDCVPGPEVVRIIEGAATASKLRRFS